MGQLKGSLDDTVVGFNGAIIRRADPSVAVLFVPDLMEAVCDPNRPDKNRECAFDLIEEWDIAWVGTVYHDALLDAVSTRKPELEAFLGVQEERHQQHLALRPGVLALVPEDMTELRKIVQAPPERRGAWWEPSTATSWYRVNRDDGTTFDLDKPERKDLIRRLHAAAAEGRRDVTFDVTPSQEELIRYVLSDGDFDRMSRVLVAAFGSDWRRYNLTQGTRPGEFWVTLYSYDQHYWAKDSFSDPSE